MSRTCLCCGEQFVHETIDVLLRNRIFKQVTFGQYASLVCLRCVERFISRPLTPEDYEHKIQPAPMPFCPFPKGSHFNTVQKMFEHFRQNADYSRHGARNLHGVSIKKFSQPHFFDDDYIAVCAQYKETAYPAVILINQYPFSTLPRPICLAHHVEDFNAMYEGCKKLLVEAIQDWMDKNVLVKRYCVKCNDYTIVRGVCEVCK